MATCLVNWKSGRYAFARTLPYIVFLIITAGVFSTTVDDPFITFRYAANITRGFGAVFNPGERVEGYSSPLHLWICVLLLKILPATGMLFKAKVVSAVASIWLIASTRKLSLTAGQSDQAAILSQLLVASNIGFVVAGTNGLETSIYCLLLVEMVSMFITEIRTGHGQLSAILMFVTILARPEGMLLAFLFWCLRAYLTYRQKLTLRNLAVWSALLLCPAICFELIRLGYYGLPLPNTYYAKHMPPFAALKDGVSYLFRPLAIYYEDGKHNQLWALSLRLHAILFWVLAARGAFILKKDAALPPILVPVAATITFILLSGGDWMPGWRFGAGALPFISILQCGVPGKTGKPQSKSENTTRSPQFAWALCLLALGLFAGVVASRRHLHFKHCAPRADKNYHVADVGRPFIHIADTISTMLPKGCSVAYSEMGYAPYQNPDKRFIDTFGLLDAQIAALPNKYKVQIGVDMNNQNWMAQDNPQRSIIFGKKPDYILTDRMKTMPAPGQIGPYILVKALPDGWVLYKYNAIPTK